jgi:glycine cleavage system H lipoate-binding protein
MTCPFLRETQVKYCQMAGVRKMIPLAGAAGAAGLPAAEKCTSAAFTTCGVYREHGLDTGGDGHCPWLRDSLMQYCAAAPVARFVPYSESVLSRCGSEAHRYCEVYLGMAHPGQDEEVDGVRMRPWLRYSPNHMWLDVSASGVCHAGIDGFLARLLGEVERISYVWLKGPHRPAAVLTVRGVDLQMVFPNSMMLTGCNLYLRADPSRCVTEPYTSGWLFEGTPLDDTAEGLLEGPAAREWMHREHSRINEFIHEQFLSPEIGQLAGDGGVFSPDLLAQLDREQILGLFEEFFSPVARTR